MFDSHIGRLHVIEAVYDSSDGDLHVDGPRIRAAMTARASAGLHI